MLTLGSNDSNVLSVLPHSLLHNKWMEMRGNKKDEMKSFSKALYLFPSHLPH